MPKTACMVGGGLCCRGAPVRAKAPGGCALGAHADRLLSRRRGVPLLRLYEVFLSHPVCFPFLFSLQHPLFSSLFSRENSVENRQILGSEPSLRLVWAQNQPNFRPNRQNAGNFAENPCIPGTYPATAWVFCRFPQFCLRFCPRPALRLRENSEFPEWSTKHPLFSLEISGNAKCWGPSVFLFVFRKTSPSPTQLHV